MTDRIDYAAKARGHLKAVGKNLSATVPSSRGGFTNNERIRLASVSAQVAQVEATLALVEQQRLANIIALGKVEIYGTYPFRHLIVEPVDEHSVQPTTVIREGLGL